MSKELRVQLTTPRVDPTTREQVCLTKILEPDYLTRPVLEIVGQMADSNLNGPHQEPYDEQQQYVATVLEGKLRELQDNPNVLSVKVYNLNQTDKAPDSIALTDVINAEYLGEKSVPIDGETKIYKMLKLEAHYSAPGGLHNLL